MSSSSGRKRNTTKRDAQALFILVKPLELYLLLQMRTISIILHAVVALSMAGNAALAAPKGNETEVSQAKYVLYPNQPVSCSVKLKMIIDYSQSLSAVTNVI